MKVVVGEAEELVIMEVLIHVWSCDGGIGEIEDEKVGNVKNNKEFEDGVSLFEDGRFFYFEA